MEEVKNDLVNSYGYKLFKRDDAGLGYYLVLGDFSMFFGYDEILNDKVELVKKLKNIKLCFSIREKYSPKYIELFLNYCEARNENNLDKYIEFGNKLSELVSEIEATYGVKEFVFRDFMK